jgi:hypothetical protein
MRGGMKDVYFSPDKSYVVAFYRKKLDFEFKELVRQLTTNYRKGIFDNPDGRILEKYLLLAL